MLEKPLAEIKNMVFLSRQDIEMISTEAIRNIYMGSNISLCKILTKYNIYLDGRDAGVVPNIMMDGYWESWITKFIAKTVQPGDYCVDAGANFGYYSLLIANLAGREGKTIAIEPNAYLCKLLAMTNNVNDFGFKIINMAASNSTGETILSVPDHLWGSATIVTKAELPGDNKKEVVKTDMLDNMVVDAGFPRVDFIKMDCEGAEPIIMQGMEKILAQNPQLKMVMEYSPYLYLDANRFTEFLFDRFEVGEIHGDSNVQFFTAADIPRLLSIADHVDLYLGPKS